MKQTTTSDPSIAAKWSRSRRLLRRIGKVEHGDPDCDVLFDLESDVLSGSIHSLDDVVAKLSAVQLAFVDGERSDGADAAALRQTIRWLKSHKARPYAAPATPRG